MLPLPFRLPALFELSGALGAPPPTEPGGVLRALFAAIAEAEAATAGAGAALAV